MKKFYLTLNPHGGQKKGPRLLKLILPYLKQADVDVKIIETTYAGHAKELANQLPFEGYDGFIVIGGDGTMHEVLNGMLFREDKRQLPIGLIPGGTGNSFLHDLELMNPVDAVNAIINGNTIDIDIAKIEINNVIKYAFNIIGWGLVTDIGKNSEKWRWLGEARYTLVSIIEVFKFKPRQAKLILDDKEIVDDYTFVIGCNTMHTGKGMKMAPKANLNDGLIDVVVVPSKFSRFKLLTLLPQVFDGSHVNNPMLQYYQVSKFSIIPQKDEILNIDGEMLGSTPIHVNMIPKAFKVFK